MESTRSDTFSNMIDALVPEPPDAAAVAWAEALTIDMPIELYVRRDEVDRFRLATTPPTQLFETTLMPVFHRVNLRFAADPYTAATDDAEEGEA